MSAPWLAFRTAATGAIPQSCRSKQCPRSPPGPLARAGAVLEGTGVEHHAIQVVVHQEAQTSLMVAPSRSLICQKALKVRRMPGCSTGGPWRSRRPGLPLGFAFDC